MSMHHALCPSAPTAGPSPTSRAFTPPATRLDLKVCEGCGALWLRSQAAGTPAGVYCRRCAQHLAGFPAPRGLRPARRPRAGRPARAPHLTPHRIPAAFAAATSTGGAR